MKKLILFTLLFSISNLHALAYLDCNQSEDKKKWKKQKNIYNTFYLFAPDGGGLEGKTNDEKNEPGIYRYYPDLGLFGLTSSMIEISKIPIKIYKIEERSKVFCGARNDKCSNYIAYIDRKDLNIYKFSARHAGIFERGIATPDNRGEFEVVGECKVISEEIFYEKIGELYSDEIEGNKI
tara:strand:+ start:172 stop:711 length:540 start_codon:yes stop_codon:yes gene_type:complete